MSIGFATYNLLTYGRDAGRQARVRQMLAGIRAAVHGDGGALVVAVQELEAAQPDEPGRPGGATGTSVEQAAGRRLRELAEATGLCCEVAPGRAAVAPGRAGLHTGLLWSEQLNPVAGGWAALGGTDWWHSLAVLALDVGGREPVVHASYQAPPIGRSRRADEAEQVLLALTHPQRRPVLLGQDANSISAARVPACDEPHAPGPTMYYDRDPDGGGTAWHPDFVYQCAVTVDARGRSSWTADRTPGEILLHGGLDDTAVLAQVPWAPTTGHWPGDPFGARRIDTILASAHLAPAVTGHGVVRDPLDTPLASELLPEPAQAGPHQRGPAAGPGQVDPQTASDHLPVLLRYEPGAIETRESES